MKAVEVKNLTFSYDQKKNAVEDVSFAVEKGVYATIIGHNGSGKSTFARHVNALISPQAGTVRTLPTSSSAKFVPVPAEFPVPCAAPVSPAEPVLFAAFCAESDLPAPQSARSTAARNA